MTRGHDPEDASVLVVGASAAGLTVAEALRRLGHRGPLTLLDAEAHAPYDRPPLSKQFLAGDWDHERLALRPAPVLDDLGATMRLGERATALDVDSRTAQTEAGEAQADRVVLATGLAPRTLEGSELTGAHVLRSLDDAVGLRAAIDATSSVVVVGDGVLGSEIAATASILAQKVTLIGAQGGPMLRSLGPLGAGHLGRKHAEAGVEVLQGGRAARVIEDDGRAAGVELADGRLVPGDVVVAAIGAVPRTQWLRGSGLELDDGIVCDARCRAGDGIWAVGDVARWHHPVLDQSLRLENRTNAVEMGLAVARDILGRGGDYAPTPFFWTDHYGSRIQVFGSMDRAEETEIVEGDPYTGRFVAVARHDGRTTGVLGWAMPKQARLRSRDIGRVAEQESAA